MSSFTGAFEHHACAPEISSYRSAFEIPEPGAFTRLAVTVRTRRLTLDYQTRLARDSEEGSALGFL